jgi:transcriptional repressor NrdR
VVVKKDGRREPFDRGRSGRAHEGVREEARSMERRRRSWAIEVSLKTARKRDSSAEVSEAIIGSSTISIPWRTRFASVYREFKDVNQFMDELKGFLTEKKKE